MRRTVSLFMVLLLFSLTACNESTQKDEKGSENVSSSTVACSKLLQQSAPVSRSESLQQPALVPHSVSNAIKDTELDFINNKLFSYIGKPILELKDEFGEEYFIYEVGSMAGAMEYYNPYICFYFDPSNYFNSAGLPEHESEQDPFKRNDLIIKDITLKSEYDSNLSSITNQDSLRKLFRTEEKITYSLLKEMLQLSPTLEHDPAGIYHEITEFKISEQYISIPGGTYSATYIIQRRSVKVVFMQEQQDYVAFVVAF